ncbi:MAG: hypothetical protein OJF47_002874 [Nitrospira sp.]|jgi:hypothetical protein|nr:MAG: hypothetical protein OJF47_002874 [Nitrospira sp.]
MQKRWPIVVGSLMLSLCPLSVQAGDFEGILHMTTTHAGTGIQSTMDWYLKGDKARVESSRPDGHTHVVIFDAQTRTMQMAMPGQKSYMEINMSGERSEQLKEALEKQTVERTGKTDKIAGYSCEIWRITDKEENRQKNDICVAKGFGKAATFWIDPKEMRRSSQPSWVKRLVEEGGFGLRSIHYDEEGKESSRMEVTSIDKKSLDNALFAFPADWAKQDMSAMQERMKAMRERKGQAGEDFSKMAEEMKKRKAGQGTVAEPSGEGGQQPDVKEMMKQFGEMMKKKQQDGQ